MTRAPFITFNMLRLTPEMFGKILAFFDKVLSFFEDWTLFISVFVALLALFIMSCCVRFQLLFGMVRGTGPGGHYFYDFHRLQRCG